MPSLQSIQPTTVSSLQSIQPTAVSSLQSIQPTAVSSLQSIQPTAVSSLQSTQPTAVSSLQSIQPTVVSLQQNIQSPEMISLPLPSKTEVPGQLPSEIHQTSSGLLSYSSIASTAPPSRTKCQGMRDRSEKLGCLNASEPSSLKVLLATLIWFKIPMHVGRFFVTYEGVGMVITKKG